ncbi:hypothetical protein [Falsirhodobacter sp. 20TX0035]|uniref:hypothetical protein n=1 Tax=Falsirhodobacter sp. 20TX0035 TaxID=3022019 RepID=UPI00232C525C|nr:hypothetical protein [Falsirhodobacter sp. 20TX0035]MDB6455033.1 hypothetical protein [Falsirhodobacter sp. 20TX0035]
MAVFSAIAATAWFASLSGFAAVAAGAAVALGQAVAWSLASAALFRPKVDRQQVQANLTQSDQPRIRAYGRNLFGGVRAFFDAKDDNLYQVVVFHHGPVDGLIRFWWDGEPKPYGMEGRLADYKRAYFRDGSGVGGDYETLDRFGDLWTSEHRLQGQATFCTNFGDPSDEDFAKRFPKGPQTVVQVEVRASRVPDLDGAPVYSENSGLCLRDLMTHADGWNIPMERLDPDSWARFTSLCAEPVALKGGGFEPRYRLCGYYTLEDPLKEVAGRMLATCDGQVYETAEGRIGILGGAWSEPDVTITGDDILEIEMMDGYDPLKVYNVLTGSFVSPAHAYQPVDVAELRDDAALATEDRRPDRLEVEMCPSGTQLQRLMKIKMGKDRREFTGKIRTSLVGLKARFPKGDGLHTIRIVAEEFRLDGIFEVTSHTYSIEGAWCEIGIASIENPYGWDPATEEKPLPPTYAAIGTPNNPQPPPQNPVIAQSYVTINQNVQAVKLVVTVDDPAKDSLTFQAQVAPGYIDDPEAGAAWVDMPAARARAETGLLDDGETYTIRIRWKGRTEWVLAGSVEVIANPDVPDGPGRFSGLGLGGDAALDWTNAADDFYRTQLRCGTTNQFSSAVFLANVAGVAGAVSDYTDTPAAPGTYYYWALTINPSGVPSAPAGPVAVTLSASASG